MPSRPGPHTVADKLPLTGRATRTDDDREVPDVDPGWFLIPRMYPPKQEVVDAEWVCPPVKDREIEEVATMGRDRRQRRRRAAAIGGAAVAAKKHRDAKLAQEEAETAPPAAPAQPAAAGGMTPDTMERLKQLGELHEQGVLSDEEFEREKAKLLG
jgi:Short C-terminal domain